MDGGHGIVQTAAKGRSGGEASGGQHVEDLAVEERKELVVVATECGGELQTRVSVAWLAVEQPVAYCKLGVVEVSPHVYSSGHRGTKNAGNSGVNKLHRQRV